MRPQLRSSLTYVAAFTTVGGMFFGLMGDMERFPNRSVGFIIFLVGLITTAFLLFGTDKS